MQRNKPESKESEEKSSGSPLFVLVKFQLQSFAFIVV